MQGVTPGRIVHYIDNEGIHLPAMIVKVWSNEENEAVVNLTVFIDHAEYTGDPVFSATSVPFVSSNAASVQTHSWHWIEPA